MFIATIILVYMGLLTVLMFSTIRMRNYRYINEYDENEVINI